MNLLSLFRSKPVEPSPRPKPKPLKFYGQGLNVRANQWRENHDLVVAANRIVTDPDFQRMLEVVRTESPANFALVGQVDLAARAVHQARSEGYSQAVDVLLSLAVPHAPEVEGLEEEFDSDTKPIEEEPKPKD